MACRSSRSAPAPRSRATWPRCDGGVRVDLTADEPGAARSTPRISTATVQAGVTRKQLNAHLRDTGLFFPIDPGADATLGGMAATRASGTNAVRYGTMRENVLGLTVVLADGRIIRTGGRARKSSAGYDLTRLLVGSEGTLGIITEVTRQALRHPGGDLGRGLQLPHVDDAVEAVILTIQAGIPVARIEMLDELQMRALHRLLEARRLPRGADAVLRVPRQRARACRSRRSRSQAIAEEHGGRTSSGRPGRRSATGSGRRGTTPTMRPWRCGPGCVGWATDVCVPISRLAECIAETTRGHRRRRPAGADRRPCRRRQLPLPDPARPGRAGGDGRAKALNKRLVERAIAMDGTCTGEHGVGMGKIDSLAEEAGAAVAVMARDQAGARSAEHHEPGQDRPGLRRRYQAGNVRDRLVQQRVPAGEDIQVVGA